MKVSGCILSVCLLLLAEQTAAAGHIETETLGQVTFECKEGWKIYNGNCYKAIEYPLPLEYAYLTCVAQGSQIYYPENEIEYLDFVSKVTDETIWFGLYKDNDGKWKVLGNEVDLDYIPKWGNLQPDVAKGNASSVHPIELVKIYDGSKKLPFVCKYRACIEDHVPCDQASKCIPKSQVCNGKSECMDNSDENNCEKYGTKYMYLEEESGSFSTGSLGDLSDKSWTLEAEVGQRIRLYIPSMNLPANCVFLEVWSGAPTYEYSHMLHRFTGNFNSVYLYSSNQYLHVRVYTIDVGTGLSSSYVMQWSTKIDQIPYDEIEETAIASWKNILIPFNDALKKPKDLMLRWLIKAPEDQLITYFLQIVPNTGYSADDVDFSLMVYGMESPLKYRYYYTSPTDQMHVISMTVPENGAVSLRYKSGCGMYIPDTYGVIVSPHPVPNDLKCSWTLNAGQSMSRGMVLKFITLNLMEDPRTNPQNRSEDKFKIYPDDSGSYITEVALYDENDLNTIVYSSMGKFKIDFESDAALMSQGFTIGFGTDCEDLDVSAETTKSTNMTYFRENVELSCPTGYKFHMEKFRNNEKVTLRCDSEWLIDGEGPGDIPECQIVYCGIPTEIENGGVEMATALTYGNEVQYFCNEGFNMTGGKRNATCNKDGSWTDVPICTSSSCPALSSTMLLNGKFEITEGNDFSDNNADFDTVVEFSCDEGYELLGALRSHCASDGWTHISNPPSCRRVYCAIPVIENSNIPLAGPTSPPMSGQNFSVACNNGYAFESGETGAISLACQNDKTLDRIPVCKDVDECETNGDSCSGTTTMCINTEGSYKCDCKQGYERVNDFNCQDIKECEDEKGGCSTTCIEEPGSYHCECDTGFELYEGNGFNGFDLPQSETGMRRGDLYHINHTCVPVQCPPLSQVANGMYLSNTLSNFHYQDTVKLQCKDGYKVETTGETITSIESTCQSDGTWDNLYSCEARECSLPTVPTYGVYDKTNVMFGETVTLTCNMTLTKQKELRAVCIYENGDVRLVGDNMNKCPEIDCGDPLLVMPAGGEIVGATPTTTFLPSTSKFTFGCQLGSELKGNSSDAEGHTMVRCGANGKWSFGTLACSNDMCTDPGTPGDAIQIADSYEEGSILYYQCNRNGFTISGPANYTCERSGSDLVWSNNLMGNLPACQDTEKPKFSGSCRQTFNIDAVDQVSFTPGTATDNFRVALFSISDPVEPSITRLIADTTVTYTAVDFAGNVETCQVAFNIIDRSSKPQLNCPDFKTIEVSTRDSGAYDPNTDITGSGGTLQVSPSSIPVSVDRIGDSETVTAKVTDEFNRETSCTFLVNFEAKACFSEQLFVDNNADRVCNDVDGSLVCESTCRTGYVFSDKSKAKNFTCTGTGVWDYTSTAPHDRTCLMTQNPQLEVPVTVVHSYEYAVTSECTTQYKTILENNAVAFQSDISVLCSSQQWKVTVNSASSGGFSRLEAGLTLTSQSSVSAEQSQECIDKIKADMTVFQVTGNMACGVRSFPLVVTSVSAGDVQLSCPNTGYLLNGDICLTVGPAKFWNEGTKTANDCPAGQYQDELGMTSCKTCPTGQYPNSDQTRCQDTCPPGFRSSSGFYPCTPCDVDTYWTDKNTCTQCTGDSSTVGEEGATDEDQCYEPCPVGTYSKTGFDRYGCTSCPVNFYQDSRGQRTCKECNSNQKTETTGSTSFNNCTVISDLPECNRTYCNDHGTCSFEYHKRVCTCDNNSGYYGDRCQNMYHICDGNPCTNQATCNKGETLRDFTCTCRTDLDICEMVEVAADKTGPNNELIIQFVANVNEAGCKKACVDNDECKEASCLNPGAALYGVAFTTDQLENATSVGQKHFRKSCYVAFGGDFCEQDKKNDCENAGCNENARCKDKINDFECLCPSSGGYTGELCSVITDPCNPDPCVRGSCESFGTVRYECNCPDGYDGDRCENNIDECAMNPNGCAYQFECIDQVNDYYCNCGTGFSGKNCQNTPDFCKTHNCNGENVCYNSLDRMEGVCVCDTTLFESLYRCQMNTFANESAEFQQRNLLGTPLYLTSIMECESLCLGNLECAVATYSQPNNNGRYICALYNSSYTGNPDSTSTAIKKNCDVRPDEAFACERKNQPCDFVDCNNGTCENRANGLKSSCGCDNGFIGDRCQHSINDCIGNLCENDAECVDGHLTYTCDCKPGFDGNRCENNIEDCPGSCNTTNGNCVDGVDSYECNCNAGYFGPNCDVDYDECSRRPCEHGGECTNLVNDFSCDCPDGWQGKTCDQEVNNCPGAQPCENDGQCISLETTSFCRCQGGATGKFCQNATLVCDVLKDVEVCINEGVCVNGQGTATCSCPVVHDTTRCYMEEGKVGKSGGNIGNLKIPPVSSSSYTAKDCKTRCLNEKDCYSVSFAKGTSVNSCIFYTVGEGTLTDDETSTHFKRNCPKDYKGVACELVRDWCSETPCENGGKCSPREVGYECDCEPGYSGTACEIKADPCESNPCRGLATCQSTPTEYICQCSGGNIWTGSSCKAPNTDITILVDSAMGQAPAMLRTPFRLETQELSVMLRCRVHYHDRDNSVQSLFALLGTSGLEFPDDFMYNFSLTVSWSGIYVRYGMEEYRGIPFDEDFGYRLFDGEWHYLGIAINANGMMSATIDALHKDPVPTGPNLELNFNAFISLGYYTVAEFQKVEVFNRFLEEEDFSKVLEGVRPDNPWQVFGNYYNPPSVMFNRQELENNIFDNPNLKIPKLNCSSVEDIYYVSDDRLTSISSIADLVAMYASVTTTSGPDLQFSHTVESALQRGYYPFIIMGEDDNTKNYGECRANLYVRYNERCPSLDELLCDAVESRPCSDIVGGHCDVKCNSTSQVLAAPIPYYITCGSLGVYDYRTPFAETYYPACVAPVEVNYRLDVSMEFAVDIGCSFIPESTINKMDETIRENFLTLIRPKWVDICKDDTCSNLADVTYNCDREVSTLKKVFLRFSLIFTRDTLEATGGGEFSAEDALRIILLHEHIYYINLDNIAGAKIIRETVVILKSTVCPTGHRLDMYGDEPMCVPCSEGYYLMDGKCKPCDLGYYQDGEAKTECIKCPDGKTTYRGGVPDSAECKATCGKGYFYDKDEDDCVPCQRHYYQNEEGKNFCIPCDKNYKTASNASSSANDCQLDCRAGEERNKTTKECMMCKRGYWRSLTMDDCQKCPANKTTFLGSHAEIEDDCKMDICLLGEYFGVSEEKCKQCDIGFYQDKLLMLNCEPCPGNKTTREMGTDDPDKCEFFCPAGYERSGTDEVCLTCERGFYKDNDGISKFEPCKECPDDTTDMMGAVSSDQCNIPICGKGQVVDGNVCKPCPQDSYSDVDLPTSATECVPCGDMRGTEQAGSTSDQCKSYCEAGKFWNGETCKSCARGYFKDNSGNTRFGNCTKCPNEGDKEKTTDGDGSTSQEACSVYKCEAGSISTSSGCKECDLNTYQQTPYPVSTVTCLPCPKKDGLITNTMMKGTASSNDCLPICDSGEYFEGSACTDCKRGTYKENVGDARFGNCTTCPDEKTTENKGAVNSSFCNIPKCPAGQYLQDKVCTECNIDTYSEVVNPNSAVECISCGTVNDTVYGTENKGSDRFSLCKPTCPGGKQFDTEEGECVDCPIGTFKGDEIRFGACTLCSTQKPGYVTSTEGAKLPSDCDLRDCQAGEKIVGTQCVKCPNGTYQDELRQDTCKECGTNLGTDGEGKTSFDDCQIECGPGLQGTEDCTKCPEGQIKPLAGYANCQDCPIDKTSNDDRTECNIFNCSIGKEYTVTGSTESCEECKLGFYKNETGNTQKCMQCEAGYTTDGTGQGSCDQLFCVPGEYLKGDKCEPCPIATYKNSAGNQACTDCPDKRTTDTVTGATAEDQCDTVICDPGNYRKVGQKLACTPCEINKYQPDAGKTSCIDCPAGEITLTVGQSDEDDCVPECNEGQEYNSTTKDCSPCKTGTFKVAVGNTEACQDCPEDRTTAGPGQTECSENKCLPGSYFVVVQGAIECKACPIGTYSDTEMQETCTDCPNDGTTQAMGTNSVSMCIEDCGDGNGYRTHLGQCQICPKGQFNARKKGVNQNTCKLCPSGKTNTQSGSTTCVHIDDDPPLERRINLRVTVTVQVALDACSDTDAIQLIIDSFINLARSLFQMKTDQCYNGERRFCTGTNCDNLGVDSSGPVCEGLARRKREITHKLKITLLFANIRDFVTDTCDDDVNIEALEIISRILRLYPEKLSDPALEIKFVGYSNVTTEDLCGLGEELVGGTCTPCPAGKFGVSVGMCKMCPLNTFQPMTGKTECTDCPDKTFTENMGSVNDSFCIPICQAGNEFDSATKTCSQCDLGYYKVSAGNDQKCTKCDDDKTTERKGSTSAADCSKTLCPAGQFYSTNQVTGLVSCSPCQIGTYNPDVMVDVCTPCGDGLTTLLTGRKSRTACITICQTGSGYNTFRRNCFVCPVGQYNNGNNPHPNTCKFCQAGTTTLSTGQSSCTPVPIPVPERRIKITLIVSFDITITSCAETAALDIVRTKISLSLRTVFIKERNKKYNLNKSFCDETCTGLTVGFKANIRALSCSAKSSARRKRAGTHTFEAQIEFENVSDSTVDTENDRALPTEEVINQILNYNKDDISPEPGIDFNEVTSETITPVCGPGQEPVADECVDCNTGRYSANGESCELCPTDTYQDEKGQTSCKSCPARTFNDVEGGTGTAACKSYCATNSNYCNNRGTCSDTGRRTASCSCFDGYEGGRCESKKEPTSNLPAILGGAIGGGGALLIIILIAVGICMRCSRDAVTKERRPDFRDPEYIQNDAYEGSYDNFGYHGGQVRPVAPYPSVGYPAIGYKPDQSFEEGTYGPAYKYRPSIDGDDTGHPNDEARYMWTA